MAASVVETSWLLTRAMLMPLDRMRVGMSSERASQTQTPGPMALERDEEIEPERDGPAVACARDLADECFLNAQRRGACGVQVGKGVLKERSTLLEGMESARSMWMGAAAVSSERA